MKTKNWIILVVLMLFIGIGIKPATTSAQVVSVSFQVFYDDLSPYGSWAELPDYGYVWVPNVGAGFSPYGSGGYWVFTDMGWTWVSEYPWGWAPFHYGYWYNDPFYGPVWIPGYEWGPGWVIWRQAPGYYGWAPMGPGGYNGDPYNQWYFVDNHNFGSTNIYNYYVDNSTNVTIINNSTIINNYAVDKSTNVKYNAGPLKTEVEQYGGKKVIPVSIKESNQPGQKLVGNQLMIYKPQIQKSDPAGKKPVPAKVVNQKDVKTPAQKATETPSQKENQNIKAQPGKAQPAKQQNKTQPAKVQPAEKQNKQQPTKVQPAEPQNKQQPDKVQPAKQQKQAVPAKQKAKQQPAKPNTKKEEKPKQ